MYKRILYFLILLLPMGCSSQKNSFLNRLYHNTTARFNAYYLAKEKLTELEDNIREDYREDYSQLLPVFYPVDSAVIDDNEELIQEIRDLASKAIDWHRISKWVDPSYFLLGKLDYYQADFDEAMNTFKYLNVNSTQKDVRHVSLIQLLRAFIDLRQFDDAAYAIDFLSKEPGISDENLQYLYKTLAYYYEVRGEREMIVTALDKALQYTGDKKERSRLNFIMGQLYQRAGLDAVAYDYYQEALRGNPPYERTFFANLYSQQVVELEKSRDFRRVRNYYDELYKDRKNIGLRDVILYEKALFELKQGEMETAVDYLLLAAEEPGENPKQKGYIYQKLSELFLNEKKDYKAAKRYVDLALENFKETDNQYSALASQKEILDEYVLNFDLIQQNDSLLRLSQLSPEEQEAYVENYIKQEEERLLQEAEEASKEKPSNIFDNLLAFGNSSRSGGTFYWDNSLAMQQGAIEFARVWGNPPLEDNWRRRNRNFQESPALVDLPEQPEAPETPAEESPAITVTLPDKESLLESIPRGPESLQAMNKDLEEAYFNLGKLLFFDLDEPALSIEYLEKLLENYPETHRKPESLYTLFLATTAINGNPARYAEQLRAQFPESQYTKSLNNPERGTGNQDNVASAENYKNAYNMYMAGDYLTARSVIQNTLNNYPLTQNTERLLLLDIMIAGKVDGREIYQQRLEAYVQNTEDTALVELAKSMLADLTGEGLKKTFEDGYTVPVPDSMAYVQENLDPDGEVESADPPAYTFDPDQTHIFLLAMEPQQSEQNKNLTADLENFHNKNFPNERLRTGNISFTREHAVIIISPFSNADEAMAYREEFLKSFNTDSLTEELKMSSFVISIKNFQELNKRKDIEEYRTFYQESYY